MATTATRNRRIKQICQLVRFKSTQIFILAGSVLMTLLITFICIGLTIRYEVEHEVANVADVDYWKDQVSNEQKLWYDKGIEELNMAMKMHSTETIVKNVRIFVIQGIKYHELAAHRFAHPFASSSEGNTNYIWDQFPYVAHLKTNSTRTEKLQVLWTGVPLEILEIMKSNCSQEKNERNGQLLTILRQAQLSGLRTGFVTNQRLTGPTGAVLYAPIPSTNPIKECNKEVTIANNCEDIANQLISSETGKSLNVLMGGGRQMFNHEVPITNSDPIDKQLCRAGNGSNILQNWRLEKLRQIKNQKQLRFELVQQFNELDAINGSKYDYLMAVLSNGDLSENLKVSSLQMMLNKTLQVLKRSNHGYMLIVEQFIKPEMDKREQLQMLNETLKILPNERNTLNLVLFLNNEISLDMPSDDLLFAQGPKSSIFYGVRDVSYLSQALAFALKNG